MNLTDAQDRAIHDHDHNLIVVAGAGSGKTFVLVERYLALLDAHPEWPLNALVAITFTDKAAQEMRDRVRQHLQVSKRLAEMDSARITTIHGLCAAILRANAAEAAIDPGFEILDEVESSVLLDTVIDDVFRSLETGDPVLELFSEYGELAVRSSLKGLEPLDVPDDLFAQWESLWREDAAVAIRRFWHGEAVQTLGQWPHGIVLGDKLADVWGAVGQWLWQLIDSDDLDASLNTVAEIAAIKVRGGSVKNWHNEEIFATAKQLLSAVRDEAKDCLKTIGDPPDELDRRAAELLRLWFDLARRVRDAYRAAKDERAALDFDDLETLTRDLLQADRVRDRYLGAEFKHVLVDEFQDTNAAQWAIIQRIADPAAPGCLFVVGDPKQSIYGFRGADVSVFEQVRAEIAQLGAAVDLSRSFRTHQRLVECFNDVFSRLLTRDPSSPVSDYEVEFGGGMQAERIDAPSDAPVLELVLLDSELLKDRDEEEIARRWEAYEIARRIKAIVEEEQRPIYDKRQRIIRPIQYGDIALLFQAMTNVTLYESALKAETIPYLTIAGKGYYDRQEIWDLLNLLRALYHPADDLALATALRSPLFGLSDDALLALRLDSSISLWENLAAPDRVPPDERPLVEFARETLNNLRSRAGRVTIAELLRAALDQTGYLAVLTGLTDGARRRSNVEKLLEKAEGSGRITLSAFTQYLQDMSENETREGEAILEDASAVQLMTVHKSKGLEFPLVILVDASYQWRAYDERVVKGLACKVYDPASNQLVKPFAHRRADQLDKLRQEAERRRLLYVAATRAQDYLIISGKGTVKDQGVKARGWLGWLIEALELSEIASKEAQRVSYGWGEVLIRFPQVVSGTEVDDRPPDWDKADEFLDESAAALLESAPRAADAPLRSLTATQIGDLGSAYQANPTESRVFFAERLRRSVYHDAPNHIDPAHSIPRAKLGEIVHRAIRWDIPDDPAALRERLRRYAWEEGIVDSAANRAAVAGAYDLLQRVRASDVFRWIEAAQPEDVYREVPFVFQTEARTIHGIIDLLLRIGAEWHLVDYKTGVVAAAPSPGQLAEHARRYHLQVGVYARAVQELAGVVPQVHIHYIRHARTVTIPTAEWTSALERLEDYIGDVASDD